MSLGRVVAYARWEVSKAGGMRGARWSKGVDLIG